MRQRKQERKEVRHFEVACGLAPTPPRFSVFGSEVIAQIELCELSLLKLKWKKKPRPYRTHKCQKDCEVVSLTPLGMGESSFQRAEGTSGKDLAPRRSPRVRTGLCDFHLELSPPSHISHTTFLGEGKSQIRALHKNSLMENSQGEEPIKHA